MAIDTAIVYRLEHSGCSWGQPHHGPLFLDPMIHQNDSPWYDAPKFGGNGPTPYTERIRFHDGMICAVFRRQLADWWTFKPPPAYKPDDWSFGVYEVPTRHLSVGSRQVTFEPKHSRFAGWFPGWVERDGTLDDRYPDSVFRNDDPWPLHSEHIVTGFHRSTNLLSGSSA